MLPSNLTICVLTESDSEDEISAVTNRGNKLKKKARYVHEGQLAPPSGPEVYKEVCRCDGLAIGVFNMKSNTDN